MTTNVFDASSAVMATDSRWSIKSGNFLLYLDDTGCEKIVIHNNYAVMFAGNGGKIQQWKDWIRSNPTSYDSNPGEEGICVCIADAETKEVIAAIKQSVVEGSYFAGSGKTHAVLCFVANKDARRAVETAKQMDHYSGGEVKFFDFESKDHNLYPQNEININQVDSMIAERGQVMTLNANSTIPFALKAVSANDAEIAAIKEDIRAGKLSADAPCDGMHQKWTDQEKADLKSAFSRVFGWTK